MPTKSVCILCTPSLIGWCVLLCLCPFGQSFCTACLWESSIDFGIAMSMPPVGTAFCSQSPSLCINSSPPFYYYLEDNMINGMVASIFYSLKSIWMLLWFAFKKTLWWGSNKTQKQGDTGQGLDKKPSCWCLESDSVVRSLLCLHV